MIKRGSTTLAYQKQFPYCVAYNEQFLYCFAYHEHILYCFAYSIELTRSQVIAYHQLPGHLMKKLPVHLIDLIFGCHVKLVLFHELVLFTDRQFASPCCARYSLNEMRQSYELVVEIDLFRPSAFSVACFASF